MSDAPNISRQSWRGALAARLQGLKAGKRIGTHCYLHVSLIRSEVDDLWQITRLIADQAGIADGDYNVVRYETNAAYVVFLLYEDIEQVPFPKLLVSRRYETSTGKVRKTEFAQSDNAPILHRKELLLPTTHPRYAEYRQLTEALEELGAYRQTSRIGHERQWRETLESLGITIIGHSATGRSEINSGQLPGARRHLTAISRNKLSVPMKALAIGGCLDRNVSVLDYGCGRGDDVRILVESAIDAKGWDPFFAPNAEKTPSDVVNLGFVLNVIDNEQERSNALREAWSLARKILCVGVMLRSQSETGEIETFTSKGTFQKYFTQSELKDYVTAITDREPISAGPGVVIVFRSDEDEQDYLIRRQIGLDYTDSSIDLDSVLAHSDGDGRIALHKELVEAYWAHCQRRARLLSEDEFPAAAEIKRVFGSLRKALKMLVGESFEQTLMHAAEKRKGEIILWLGLNQFERRRSSNAWPMDIRRDITRLFGRRQDVVKSASALLFSLGDAEQWRHDFSSSERCCLGFVDEDGDYMFLSERLREQSLRIRMLVGCACRVIEPGEMHELVRINPARRRVSWLHFDKFDSDVFPALNKRVRVDLGRADAEVIDYSNMKDKPVLIFKQLLLGSGGEAALDPISKLILPLARTAKPSFHFRASQLRAYLAHQLQQS